jgi:trehalose 6-phosphate synthase
MSRLVVVANRTPSPGPAAGGLAVALRQPLLEREGFWFGWSGHLSANPAAEVAFRDIEGMRVGTIDLTREDHQAYYYGYSNSILWPAFHQRLDLAHFDAGWYDGYRRVNRTFAAALKPHLRPDDIIWVHDYHLIPLASSLRALGVRNRIGFYLHIPFPTPEALYAVPHHADLARDFANYDLVGLQAERDLRAFRAAMAHEPFPVLEGKQPSPANFSTTKLAVIPIGSDPDAFAALAKSPAATKMINRTRAMLRDQTLILGVDRLDYSKGLTQRVQAFELLLADNAHLRKTVHFMQVAPPSRDGIKEYREISDALDASVGHVMGRFSEPDWQPLTYVKRAYSQSSLAGLYRLAGVGLVTPLRDGMNLVAHEFVAAQGPDDPGVLVLSHFAGAAEIFPDAVRVNAFDVQETANAVRLALEMPLDERRERHRNLLAACQKYSVVNWAARFLDDLAPKPQPLRRSA